MGVQAGSDHVRTLGSGPVLLVAAGVFELGIVGLSGTRARASSRIESAHVRERFIFRIGTAVLLVEFFAGFEESLLQRFGVGFHVSDVVGSHGSLELLDGCFDRGLVCTVELVTSILKGFFRLVDR